MTPLRLALRATRIYRYCESDDINWMSVIDIRMRLDMFCYSTIVVDIARMNLSNPCCRLGYLCGDRAIRFTSVIALPTQRRNDIRKRPLIQFRHQASFVCYTCSPCLFAIVRWPHRHDQVSSVPTEACTLRHACTSLRRVAHQGPVLGPSSNEGACEASVLSD